MPSLLDCCPEVRMLIYEHVFCQSNGEILGLSREPMHDYEHGPPDDWIANSRQEGLVYSSDAPRLEPTNSRFLRTCRTISEEAFSVFYGQNKIVLYAEDNNDIFYWLLDIGQRNRHAIRHLEVSWAYGVSIQSGKENIHGILERINYMDNAEEEEIRDQREQLIRIVRRMEVKTVRLIIRTLNLLASNQDLISLDIYLPGVDGGDIWDLPNDNIYFADEIFSNSTANVHACIPRAISQMIGVQTITIGYTKDIELAEEIARQTGAKELVIRTCPEAHSLNLDAAERKKWIESGWRLVREKAYKSLVGDDEQGEEKQTSERFVAGAPQQQQQHEPGGCSSRLWEKEEIQRALSSDGYSEGGRLKASMIVGGGGGDGKD